MKTKLKLLHKLLPVTSYLLLVASYCLFHLHKPAFAVTRTEPLIVDHNAVQEFDNIPSSFLNSIDGNDEFKIYYGHTSHGRQIVEGMSLLDYNTPISKEKSDDLGHNGDTSWVSPTRSWLNSHSDYNIVMWSWCTGVSDNTEAGINTYLNAMNQLETDYPNVSFVYMTGHLFIPGYVGTRQITDDNNQQIRDYCIANNKVLFDFADIEGCSPDGHCYPDYYPDETHSCKWCSIWCASHSCPSCTCAHSHCFNCYQKGKAFWWMMAKMAGWQGSGEPSPSPSSSPSPSPSPSPSLSPSPSPTTSPIPGCEADINNDKVVNLADINRVLTQYSCTTCPDEDINQDGIVNLADISFILQYWGQNCE